MQLLEQAKDFLRGRTGSYCRVFSTKSRDAQVVLADLARFCRAHVSTGAPNPYVAARLDGRREVFLRISQHLNLDDQTLWLLFGGQPTQRNNDNA